MSESQEENEALKIKNSIQKQRIEELEAKTSDLNEEISQLSFDLNDLKIKYDKKPSVKEEDILPENSWVFDDFSTSLNSKILSIVQNKALKANSKLQNVYKTINKHFIKQINAREKAMAENQNEMEEIKNCILENLMPSIIAVTGNPVDFDIFLNGRSIKCKKSQNVNNIFYLPLSGSQKTEYGNNQRTSKA